MDTNPVGVRVCGIAAPPLIASVGAVSDPTFRPGNFPPEFTGLIGAALAGTAAGWFYASRRGRPGRVDGLIIVVGSLVGLYVGGYGLWGTSVLLGDCAASQRVATSIPIDPSDPGAYCRLVARSLLIGYYGISVGVASVASLASAWWLARKSADAALD
jgi:hypothetical protein